MILRNLGVWAAAAAALAACTVGPDYKKPDAIVPATFKEMKGFIPVGWKLGEPQAAIDRGAWWSVYNDPVLDGLERQVEVSNQTLKQSAAAYEQARAVVQEARAGLFPTATITPGVTRQSSGAESASSSGSGSFGGRTRTTYSIEGSATWDPDIWGKIRRTIEGDVAAAQVSAADLAAARLSAQATLAIDYFELRSADQLKTLLDDTVAQYKRSLQLTQNQYDVGVAAKSDVITAQAQLLAAQASAVNVGVTRATLEHAIAVLIGRAPADLTIAPTGLPAYVPVVPASVPSALLERRPDIAAAERAMQEQNAQIGVAIAAFYPDLSLTALYGYSGNPLGSLISASNRVWSLGASAAETVFNGGLRSATVAAARATYDGAVANYRQVVLTAFQGVEDQLSTLRILQDQAAIQTEAVKSAQQAVDIALNEYRAGTQAYTTVVTAQATLLQDQETALTILQDRLVASATLIEDLGGGWDVDQLPDTSSVKSDK
jgi:NodT family efflux transporter outer membrane factor (OMF) lipoprotein